MLAVFEALESILGLLTSLKILALAILLHIECIMDTAPVHIPRPYNRIPKRCYILVCSSLCYYEGARLLKNILCVLLQK